MIFLAKEIGGVFWCIPKCRGVGMIKREEILDFLSKNKTMLSQEFGVEGIALFGSYARNQARADSDIDLMVKASVKSFDQYFNLKSYLEKNFNKKVDLVYSDSIRPFIKKFIEKDLIYA